MYWIGWLLWHVLSFGIPALIGGIIGWYASRGELFD